MYAVVFVNDTFARPWPESDSFDDPNEIVWGRDVAEALVQNLRARGFDAVEGSLVCGEGGWHFHVRHRRLTCMAFVHWAPLGEPPSDHWVVHVTAKRRLSALLCRDRVRTDTVAHDVALTIKEIVETSAGSSEVQVLDGREFRSVY